MDFMLAGEQRKKLATAAWHLQVGQYDLARALLVSIYDRDGAEAQLGVLRLFADLARWGLSRSELEAEAWSSAPPYWLWDSHLAIQWNVSLPSLHHLRCLAWHDYTSLAAQHVSEEGTARAELIPIPLQGLSPDTPRNQKIFADTPKYMEFTTFCRDASELVGHGNHCYALCFGEIVSSYIADHYTPSLQCQFFAPSPAGATGEGVHSDGSDLAATVTPQSAGAEDPDEDSSDFTLDAKGECLNSTSLRRTSASLRRCRPSDFNHFQSPGDVADFLYAVFTEHGGAPDAAPAAAPTPDAARRNRGLAFLFFLKVSAALPRGFEIFCQFTKRLTSATIDAAKSGAQAGASDAEILDAISEMCNHLPLCDPSRSPAERQASESHTGAFLREILRIFERRAAEEQGLGSTVSRKHPPQCTLLRATQHAYTRLAEALGGRWGGGGGGGDAACIPAASTALESALREKILGLGEVSPEPDAASLLEETKDIIQLLTQPDPPGQGGLAEAGEASYLSPLLFSVVAERLSEAYGISPHHLVLLKALHLVNDAISRGEGLGEGGGGRLSASLHSLLSAPAFRPLRPLLVVLLSAAPPAPGLLPWSGAKRPPNLGGIIQSLAEGGGGGGGGDTPADPGIRYLCESALFEVKLRKSISEMLSQSLSSPVGVAFMESHGDGEMFGDDPLWAALLRVFEQGLRYTAESEAGACEGEGDECLDRVSRISNALARGAAAAGGRGTLLKSLQSHLLLLDLGSLQEAFAARPALLRPHFELRHREASLLQGVACLIALLKAVVREGGGATPQQFAAQIMQIASPSARLVTAYQAFKLMYLTRAEVKGASHALGFHIPSRVGAASATQQPAKEATPFLSEGRFAKGVFEALLEAVESAVGEAQAPSSSSSSASPTPASAGGHPDGQECEEGEKGEESSAEVPHSATSCGGAVEALPEEGLRLAEALRRLIRHALCRLEIAEQGRGGGGVSPPSISLLSSIRPAAAFIAEAIQTGDGPHASEVVSAFCVGEPPQDNPSSTADHPPPQLLHLLHREASLLEGASVVSPLPEPASRRLDLDLTSRAASPGSARRAGSPPSSSTPNPTQIQIQNQAQPPSTGGPQGVATSPEGAEGEPCDGVLDALPVEPLDAVATRGLVGHLEVQPDAFEIFASLLCGGTHPHTPSSVAKVIHSVGGEQTLCGSLARYVVEGVQLTHSSDAAAFLSTAPSEYLKRQVFLEGDFAAAADLAALAGDDLAAEVFLILCDSRELPPAEDIDNPAESGVGHATPPPAPSTPPPRGGSAEVGCDASPPPPPPRLSVSIMRWLQGALLQEGCGGVSTPGLPSIPLLAAATLLDARGGCGGGGAGAEVPPLDIPLLSHMAEVASGASEAASGTPHAESLGQIDRWLAARLCVVEDFLRRHAAPPAPPGDHPTAQAVMPLDAERISLSLAAAETPGLGTGKPHPTHHRKVSLLRGDGRGPASPPPGSAEVMRRIGTLMASAPPDGIAAETSSLVSGVLSEEVVAGFPQGGVSFYRREAERFRYSASLDEALACVAFGELTPEGPSGTALIDTANLLLRTAQQLQGKAAGRRNKEPPGETPASSSSSSSQPPLPSTLPPAAQQQDQTSPAEAVESPAAAGGGGGAPQSPTSSGMNNKLSMFAKKLGAMRGGGGGGGGADRTASATSTSSATPQSPAEGGAAAAAATTSEMYSASAELLIQRASEFLIRVGGGGAPECLSVVVHDFLLSPRYRGVLPYRIVGSILAVVPRGTIPEAEGLRRAVALHSELLAHPKAQPIVSCFQRFPELLGEAHIVGAPAAAKAARRRRERGNSTPPAATEADLTSCGLRPSHHGLLLELFHAVGAPESCLDVLQACFEFSLAGMPPPWRELSRLLHGRALGALVSAGSFGEASEYLETLDAVWGEGEAREVCLGFAACPLHSSEDKEIVAGIGGVQHEVFVGLTLLDSLGDALNPDVLNLVKRPDVLAEQLLRDGNVHCVHHALLASPEEVLPIHVLDFYARKSMSVPLTSPPLGEGPEGLCAPQQLHASTPAFSSEDPLRQGFVYSQAPCLSLCKSLVEMMCDDSAAAETCLGIAADLSQSLLKDVAPAKGRKWGVVAVHELCALAESRLLSAAGGSPAEDSPLASQLRDCGVMLSRAELLKSIELSVGHRYDVNPAVTEIASPAATPLQSDAGTPRMAGAASPTPRGDVASPGKANPPATPASNKIILFATLSIGDLENPAVVQRVVDALVEWDRVGLAARVASCCGIPSDSVWISAGRRAILLGWWTAAWDAFERASPGAVAAVLSDIHDMLEGPPIQRHAEFGSDTGEMDPLPDAACKGLAEARHAEALRYTARFGSDDDIVAFYISRGEISQAVGHVVEKGRQHLFVPRIFVPVRETGGSAGLRAALKGCDPSLLLCRESAERACGFLKSIAGEEGCGGSAAVAALTEAAEWQAWMQDHARCAWTHVEIFLRFFGWTGQAGGGAERGGPSQGGLLPMFAEFCSQSAPSATPASVSAAFFNKLVAVLETAAQEASSAVQKGQPYVAFPSRGGDVAEAGGALELYALCGGYAVPSSEGGSSRVPEVPGAGGVILPPTHMAPEVLDDLSEKLGLQVGVLRILRDQVSAVLKAGGGGSDTAAVVEGVLPVSGGRPRTLFGGRADEKAVAEHVLSLDFAFGFQLIRQLDLPRTETFREAVLGIARRRDDKRVEATLRQMNNTMPPSDLDGIVLACVAEFCAEPRPEVKVSERLIPLISSPSAELAKALLHCKKWKKAFFAAAELAEQPNNRGLLQYVLDTVQQSGVTNAETTKVIGACQDLLARGG